jgi:hypothetical protein
MSILNKRYSDINISIPSTTLNEIINNYKIIYVPYFTYDKIHSSVYEDQYFIRDQYKINIITKMVYYYFDHPNMNKYLKTDYYCCEKEKVCICNINAQYALEETDIKKEGYKYVSWFKELNNIDDDNSYKINSSIK